MSCTCVQASYAAMDVLREEVKKLTEDMHTDRLEYISEVSSEFRVYGFKETRNPGSGML